jgi:hypothetical protein
MISGFLRRVNEIFRSSRMLRSIDWYLVADVSGQPIGLIFKGQADISLGYRHN